MVLVFFYVSTRSGIENTRMTNIFELFAIKLIPVSPVCKVQTQPADNRHDSCLHCFLDTFPNLRSADTRVQNRVTFRFNTKAFRTEHSMLNLSWKKAYRTEHSMWYLLWKCFSYRVFHMKAVVKKKDFRTEHSMLNLLWNFFRTEHSMWKLLWKKAFRTEHSVLNLSSKRFFVQSILC